MKLVIEPSAAVPLAVVLYSHEFRAHLEMLAQRKGKGSAEAMNVGLVFSGGNVDVKTLGELFARIE
jgi:threonine dehydratase